MKMESKVLSSILIPGTSNKVDMEGRISRAVRYIGEEWDSRTVYVLTGGKTVNLDSRYESEAHMALEALEERIELIGILPKDIRLESKSQSSIGNIVNTFGGGKVEGDELGLVSNWPHLLRLGYIVNQEKFIRNIPKNIRIHKMVTDTGVGAVGYAAEGLMMINEMGKYVFGLNDSERDFPGNAVKSFYNGLRRRIVGG
jgi:hypothetical protein